MLEHFGVGGLALEILLHLVNAAARAVEFVTEQLIGRTGRIAKAAVHAFAQDRQHRFGMAALLNFWRELGLHL